MLSPVQIKNTIIEWLDESKEPYHVETPEEIGTDPIEFGIIVGSEENKIMIYIPQSKKSRIVFNMHIIFTEKQREIIQSISKEDFSNFILSLTDKMTIYEVYWTFQGEDQNLVDLQMFKSIDESALTKDRFYQTLERCEVVKSQIMRTIIHLLGSDEQIPLSSQSTADKPMYG